VRQTSQHAPHLRRRAAQDLAVVTEMLVYLTATEIMPSVDTQ
jgi:hypothetical protein